MNLEKRAEEFISEDDKFPWDESDKIRALSEFARQEVEKALKEPIQIIMQLVHSDDDICKCPVCKLGKPFLAQQTKQQ